MNIVHYLMSGPAHLPYLVVSLRSLRRHFNGMVIVHAWPESNGLVSQIQEWDLARGAADGTRLQILVGPTSPVYRGKNDQFLHKIQLMQQQTADDNHLYLDADTIVAGDLTPLFNAIHCHGFVATQFGDWTTGGGIINGRINRLRNYPEIIDQTLVAEVTMAVWPSVNGGVFGCRSDSPVLPVWEKYTRAAVEDIFIADETVLHILQPKFIRSGEMTVLLDGQFNCSPKHQPKNLPDEQVKIWHGHGDSFLRPEKSRKGFDLWYPLFLQCCEANVGGIRDWLPQIQNKWLTKIQSEGIMCG